MYILYFIFTMFYSCFILFNFNIIYNLQRMLELSQHSTSVKDTSINKPVFVKVYRALDYAKKTEEGRSVENKRNSAGVATLCVSLEQQNNHIRDSQCRYSLNPTFLSKSRSRCRAKSIENININTQFKIPQTSNLLAFQSLKRNFQKSLSLIQAPSLLTREHIIDILCCLGFLQNTQTPEQQRLINNLYVMLHHNRNGITKQNLLKFLTIICNLHADKQSKSGTKSTKNQHYQTNQSNHYRSIEKNQLGEMDNQGNWILTAEDQLKIKKMFSPLYYKKISNQNIKYKDSAQSQTFSFHPRTLQNSQVLAEIKRSKMLQQINNMTEIKSKGKIDLTNLLILNKTVQEKRKNKKVYERQKSIMEQCTFQPKINKIQIHKLEPQSGIKPKDKCIQLYQTTKTKKNTNKFQISRMQEIEQQQLKQCTFKPMTLKYKPQPQPKIRKIKNQNQSIERLKAGTQNRQLHNIMKTRGYPHGIENWQSFVKQLKNKNSAMPNQKISTNTSHFQSKTKIQQVTEKKVILNMQLKLMDETQSLNVYEGDSIQNLTCKILVKNQLPYQYFSKISELIQKSLLSCSGIIIKQGFIYLLR